MVRLTISFIAPSARASHDLLDAVRSLIVRARLEPGCEDGHAWADPDYTIHYIEEWTTEADLRRRVRSDEFTSLLGIVDSAREPRVQFDFIWSSRGLDYVAEVRGLLDPTDGSTLFSREMPGDEARELREGTAQAPGGTLPPPDLGQGEGAARRDRLRGAGRRR